MDKKNVKISVVVAVLETPERQQIDIQVLSISSELHALAARRRFEQSQEKDDRTHIRLVNGSSELIVPPPTSRWAQTVVWYPRTFLCAHRLLA